MLFIMKFRPAAKATIAGAITSSACAPNSIKGTKIYAIGYNEPNRANTAPVPITAKAIKPAPAISFAI